MAVNSPSTSGRRRAGTAGALGEIVRELRERALLTQEGLAARTGLSVGTVRGLEAGRIERPRATTMRQLVEVLGTSEPDRRRLLAAAGEPSRSEPAEPDRTGLAPALAELPAELPALVPAQLPAAITGFVGRADALRVLDDLLQATGDQGVAPAALAAITGTAGIGKTALAVWWAHKVTDRFPDGQLHVNLRGFDPAGHPIPAGEAVRGFLEALQVPPQRIPATLEGQVGIYRSMLAHRRMLILLDNAHDADQVRPLLPGAPGCLTLVTSRNHLVGLAASPGARLVTLDLPSRDEARQLLTRRLGPDRVATEPDAVDQIIDRCARLPLALAIVAARSAAQPKLPLGVLAAQLREACLDAVAGDDPPTDVRTVLGWSYHALKPETARLFRLLGLHPGADLSASAAASLAARPIPDARRLLAELTTVHLVTEYRPGRYALHDLLRAYATELTSSHDPVDERRAAVTRLLDHYLHAAHAAERIINPLRDPIDIPLGTPAPGTTVEHFRDDRHAMAWLDTEHRALLAVLQHAADRHLDTHTWQLAWALDTYLDRHGHWHSQATAWHEAQRAAHRLGHPAAQARAHYLVARTQTLLGRYDAARASFHRSLDLHTRTDGLAGQAISHRGLGGLAMRQGNPGLALHHSRQALALYQAAGHQRGLAFALNDVGWCHTLLGDHAQALIHCGQALALFRQLGEQTGEADTWDSLGRAHHHLGQHAEAVNCYRRALDLFGRVGDHRCEAITLTNLGDTYLAAGQPDAARDVWTRALTIFRDLDLPDQAARVQSRLHTPA